MEEAVLKKAVGCELWVSSRALKGHGFSCADKASPYAGCPAHSRFSNEWELAIIEKGHPHAALDSVRFIGLARDLSIRRRGRANTSPRSVPSLLYRTPR